MNPAGSDVVAYAKEKGIVTVGYSVMSGWPFAFPPMLDPIVQAIAYEHSVTASQVGWLVDKDFW